MTRAAPPAPDSGNNRITIVGEALIDVVQRVDGRVDESPGGSPANVALTVGRLGHNPRLVAKLGRDVHGDLIRAWLAESGVQLQTIESVRTATATARLSADGSASYDFDLDWRLPPDLSIPSPDIFHTGSIATFLQPGADAVRALTETARETSLVTFDPNARPTLLADRDDACRSAESFVALADVVKASDDDLEWLYPDRSSLESAVEWQRSGPAIVVVTHGADGAIAVTEDATVQIPGRTTEVVDTVGAGDTFMGALIHGLASAGYTGAASRRRLRGIPTEALTQILDLAATAAAITVSRPGANPPRLTELPTV